MNTPRLIAIDWSGRSGAEQRRALWLAEVISGELVRLEGGRTRAELIELLIAEADRDPNLLVGFDFAFSLPAWYLRDRKLTPRQLWALLAEEALTPAMRRFGLARWMNRPELPFWTTSEAHARLRPEQLFRRTEHDVRVPGTQPKSVFQLVGAGQVGRGSLYGMQALHRLSGAGFRIWPFNPPALPLVVEIFPRVLTGPVRKNSPSERERYLGTEPMLPDLRRLAAASEDAFDAAISAVVMAARVEELRALPDEPGYAIEGKIWQPRNPVALGTGGRLPQGAHGELATAVALVIREAAARGESATAQADEVLDMLDRRGLLGGRADRSVGQAREGFEPPTARSVAWCSTSHWSAPDGSALLTLGASSVRTDQERPRRIVWMISLAVRRVSRTLLRSMRLTSDAASGHSHQWRRKSGHTTRRSASAGSSTSTRGWPGMLVAEVLLLRGVERVNDSFWKQIVLQAVGPAVAAVIGTLVIGSAAAWITRRAQDHRANHELRHSLVVQMTEAASTFQFEAQRYRRATHGRGDEGLDMTELRRRLSDQYLRTRVMGEILESRLSGYFRSNRPRQLWHRSMDLASIMYFDLTGMATDRIRQADAGPEHSGLSAEELKDLHPVIESFRKALRDAVRAVLEEPFFPARYRGSSNGVTTTPWRSPCGARDRLWSGLSPR